MNSSISTVVLEWPLSASVCSQIIAPDGSVLVDMKSKIGVGYAEIDPKKKYYKAAGFRGKVIGQIERFKFYEEAKTAYAILSIVLQYFPCATCCISLQLMLFCNHLSIVL